MKPQSLDNFALCHSNNKLSELIPIKNDIVEKLELSNLLDHTVSSLSGASYND